jgi:hypothetical protein
MAAHPAIKELWYGCANVLVFPSHLSHSMRRLGTNKAITDASCTALANLLSTGPTFERLE